MTFENAWLTEEEKKEFEAAKLLDPRYFATSKVYLSRTSWIIDRDKNIALVYCGILDRDDYRKEVFALLYGKFDNEHLISFTLMHTRFSEEEEEDLMKKYGVEGAEKWKLIECRIPSKLDEVFHTNIVYNILTDALSVYGINGHPDRQFKMKAILEGKNGEYYYGTQYN